MEVRVVTPSVFRVTVVSVASKINSRARGENLQKSCEESTNTSKEPRRLEEENVRVKVNHRIVDKGTRIGIEDGEISVIYMEEKTFQIFLPIIKERKKFGCFEETFEDKDETGRICHWSLFLQNFNDPEDPRINIVGKVVDKIPVFETTRDIFPGEQLIAYFDCNIRKSETSMRRTSNATCPTEEAPLDLSRPASQGQFDTDVDESESPLSSSEDTYNSQAKTCSPYDSKAVVSMPFDLFKPYTSSLKIPESSESNKKPASPTEKDCVRFTKAPQNPPTTIPLTHSFLNAPTIGVTRPILRTRGRERSLLPCEVCGKAFDRPSLLKRHLRTHTGEKPHVCDVCSKGFSTSSSLNTHRRIHSGEKPHQCPICGKRFTASSNLYYHRMTHNKEKPHKCMLCGKSFPTPGDLKSHQYVHSGSWPYNCPICHRGFSKQTNLRNHLLLHSGDKPHSCKLCHKKFALACNLRAHLRTHEEEPVTTCTTCKRSFLSSLNMLTNGKCKACILHGEIRMRKTPTLDVKEFASSRSSRILPRDEQEESRSRTESLSEPKASGDHQTDARVIYQGTQPNIPAPGMFRTFESPTSAPIIPVSNLPVVTKNPLLEQLFEWNYRFAKETAGNLSLMQQKLFESHMLAARLMTTSTSQPPPMRSAFTLIAPDPSQPSSLSDLLRCFQSPEYSTMPSSSCKTDKS